MSATDNDINAPARFVVGIDLGTTNCSTAYVDTQDRPWKVRDLLIPQLVAPATVEALPTLPSFHYQAAAGEFAPGALRLPWDSGERDWVVGAMARDHGAATPGRLVVSAKSWLSHSGVDRTAPLLPWHGAADVEPLSPVEVSSRYLGHIRAAWDHAHPEHPLAGQDVVLTVPASFDEVARELTIEAARRAGMVRLVLVEEPQAAFYAWINSQGDAWQTQVQAGQKILVADVGGGTTDLTLIRVRPAERGNVLFHRIAVGEHLILGGDNLDLALAHHLERKVAGEGNRLPVTQWAPLVRSCRAIKETLLGENPPPRMTISVAAPGARLVGGAKQVELSRDEAQQLLVEGFLPKVSLEDRPTSRRSGFQEFGLPYAPDAAITRYLASFLGAHRDTQPVESPLAPPHDPARPDIVLFNGGFFASAVLRQRFVEVLSDWFSSGVQRFEPKVLRNERLDLAVSRGAAYYGMVRRGEGVRISGGLAQSYYIGVEGEGGGGDEATKEGTEARRHEGTEGGQATRRSDEGEVEVEQALRLRALCLLPAGIEEGQDVELEHTFRLLIRRPVEFPLFVSATRTTDPPGALVDIDPEQLTALPPIRTVLQSGRKAAADVVPVRLHAKLTEIGTLELWAAESPGDRRWRLQFDVRSATRAEVGRHTGAAEAEGFVEQQVIEPAVQLITATFSRGAQRPPTPARAPAPGSLVRRLEEILCLSRHEWPSSLMRTLWEALIAVQEGRRLSVEHESRWLNLAGFCLRPGYGLAADDWRVGQMWRLFPARVHHPRNELCRAEWWILWRRIAGGLSAGQQLTAAESLLPALRSRLRPKGPMNQPKTAPFQYGPHETAEAWRFLGAVELLKPTLKAELGELILSLLPREKPPAARHAAVWALGRIASRQPVYGPLNALVEAEVAEGWITRLMAMGHTDPPTLFALVLAARRTGDRYRDIAEPIREGVVDYLKSASAPLHYVELVAQGGQLAEEEQKTAFGESLPRGLSIA